MNFVIKKMVFLFGLGFIALAISSCSIPRSAALKQEVLTGGEFSSRTFDVVPVNNRTIQNIENWSNGIEFKAPGLGSLNGSVHEIVIRPSDKLLVSVWDNSGVPLFGAENISGQAKIGLSVVNQIGEVFLPYIGTVTVGDLTVAEARALVNNLYRELLPSAQVQLTHNPGPKNSVTLVSPSTSSSIPLLSDSDTLLDVVANSGSPLPGNKNMNISVFRGGKRYSSPLSEVVEIPELNVQVEPQDRVLILNDKRYFIVLGASNSQRVIDFPRDEVSALEAISDAGGLKEDRADISGILVFRVVNDPKTNRSKNIVFVVDLTNVDGLFSANAFPLESGDLLLATESPITAITTLLNFVGLPSRAFR